MKRRNLMAIAALVLIIGLSGCGESDSSDRKDNGTQEEIAVTDEAEMTDGNTVTDEAEMTDGNTATDEAEMTDGQIFDENGNVDLTTMSSTMVYSEVYNMMQNADDYIGKTIKMAGSFSVYEDESTGKVYFACLIADATACCSQGIEFVLSGEHAYPEDYPEIGSEIVVQGIFDVYEENGYNYCQLKDATMQ